MNVNGEDIPFWMSSTFSFRGIRVTGGYVSPVTWTVDVDLAAEMKDNPAEHNLAGIAYEKIMFWVESQLADVVVTKHDDEVGLHLAEFSGNISMLLPEEPTDDLLAIILHAKLNAIANGELEIGNISVKSDTASVAYHYTGKDNYETLPGVDYLGNLKIVHDTPWWHRHDIMTVDVSYNPDDKEEVESALAYVENRDADYLQVFEAAITKQFQNPDEAKTEADIIIMPSKKSWKPSQV